MKADKAADPPPFLVDETTYSLWRAACFEAHDADRLLEKLRADHGSRAGNIAPDLTAVTRATTRFQEVATSLSPASG